MTDLLAVEISAIRPHAPPRLTGLKAKGLAYQRRLGKMLQRLVDTAAATGGPWAGSKLLAEVWLRFHDANGPGYAQPDFIIHLPDLAIVIDAKLTHTPLVEPQLFGLYKPLVEKLLGVPAVCVEAFYNPGVKPLGRAQAIEALEELFDFDTDFYAWHSLA